MLTNNVPRVGAKAGHRSLRSVAAQRCSILINRTKKSCSAQATDRAKIQNILHDFPEDRSGRAKAEAESLVHELRVADPKDSERIVLSETLILTQEVIREIYTATVPPLSLTT